MDFDLGPDEQALQDATRRFCAERYPMDVVRRHTGGPDRRRWGALAGMGVFGPDLDPIGRVLVFEELGRALVPGPLVATAVAADVVDGAATGDRLVTMVERAPAPVLVEHPDADVLLVLDGAGIHRVDTAELRAEPIADPLDPTTPVVLVDRLPAGTPVAGPATAQEWRSTGSLLTSALLAGIAAAVTDDAVTYASERRQFGRPIGSFQAIKHLLADMFACTEVARAAVHAAGLRPTDARAVAGARVLAGTAALDNARANVQVHGGIGFTWEADPHLFLKRALLHDTQLGSVEDAAEAVADRLHTAHHGTIA